MNANNKRTLTAMTYYTLIGVMATFAIIFGIFLASKIDIVWAQIAYFAWTAAIVLDIAYDIICVISGKDKYTSGIILYVISIVTILASILVFFEFATEGTILPTSLFPYISIVFLSYFINALAVCIYCSGEKLINLGTY